MLADVRPQVLKKPEAYSLEYVEDVFGPRTTQMSADRLPQQNGITRTGTYDAPIGTAHGLPELLVAVPTPNRQLHCASSLPAGLLFPLQPFKAPSILLIVLLSVPEPSS
jgi:hypothetical protein